MSHRPIVRSSDGTQHPQQLRALAPYHRSHRQPRGKWDMAAQAAAETPEKHGGSW